MSGVVRELPGTPLEDSMTVEDLSRLSCEDGEDSPIHANSSLHSSPSTTNKSVRLHKATGGSWDAVKRQHDGGRLIMCKAQRKMPSTVDLTIPGIAKVWSQFKELDGDSSGLLEMSELSKLGRQLDLKWSNKQLKQAFKDMKVLVPPPKDGIHTGVDLNGRMATNEKDGVSFTGFAMWYARYQAGLRREMRRRVRELFTSVDRSTRGIIDEQEFTALILITDRDTILPAIERDANDGVQGAAHPEKDAPAHGDGRSSSPSLRVKKYAVPDAMDRLAAEAWIKVRKVPYSSAVRDKRQLAEMMIQQERGNGVGASKIKMGVNFIGERASNDCTSLTPNISLCNARDGCLWRSVRVLVEIEGRYGRHGHPGVAGVYGAEDR